MNCGRRWRLLAELDEYYARARLALRWDGVDVAISDRGAVRILRGRHPLLIERLKDAVVPLSLEIAAAAAHAGHFRTQRRRQDGRTENRRAVFADGLGGTVRARVARL